MLYSLLLGVALFIYAGTARTSFLSFCAQLSVLEGRVGDFNAQVMHEGLNDYQDATRKRVMAGDAFPELEANWGQRAKTIRKHLVAARALLLIWLLTFGGWYLFIR